MTIADMTIVDGNDFNLELGNWASAANIFDWHLLQWLLVHRVFNYEFVDWYDWFQLCSLRFLMMVIIYVFAPGLRGAIEFSLGLVDLLGLPRSKRCFSRKYMGNLGETMFDHPIHGGLQRFPHFRKWLMFEPNYFRRKSPNEALGLGWLPQSSSSGIKQKLQLSIWSEDHRFQRIWAVVGFNSRWCLQLFFIQICWSPKTGIFLQLLAQSPSEGMFATSNSHFFCHLPMRLFDSLKVMVEANKGLMNPPSDWTDVFHGDSLMDHVIHSNAKDENRGEWQTRMIFSSVRNDMLKKTHQNDQWMNVLFDFHVSSSTREFPSKWSVLTSILIGKFPGKFSHCSNKIFNRIALSDQLGWLYIS